MFRVILLAITFLVMATDSRLIVLADSSPAPQTPAASSPAADWVLSFDEEFGGATVDTAKWKVTDGTYEQREDVKQYYSPSELKVHDGSLFINAEHVATGGREYTSGDLRTLGKFAQLYGKFEMRARVPSTPGCWPAFWLLPAADTWPPEIDISESMGGNPDKLCDSNHWGSTMATHGNHWFSWTEPGFDITAWHTYSVDWERGALTWYVDDQPGYTKPDDEPVSAVPMYMRLNTAVGSAGGNPDDGTWPQIFQIDWVRAYRHKGVPPPVCAGPDRVVTYPLQSVELDGYSCNPLGSVSLTWAMDSGPGTVVFATPSSPVTTATFSAPGEYRLRLAARDGALTASDAISVFVEGPGDDARTAMQNVVAVPVPVSQSYHAPVVVAAQDLTLHAHAATNGSSPSQGRMYLKFDISGARPVTSARLRLCGGIAPDGAAGSADMGIYSVADDGWRETDLATANMPALGPMVAKFNITPDVWRGLNVWQEVDVSKYITQAIAGHREFVSLCVMPIDATQDYDVTFHTRMAPGEQPALVLTGPDPAAGAPSVLGSPNWITTFDDEFDGSGIDWSKWTVSMRDEGNGVTSPFVHYLPANATVSNGTLKLASTTLPDKSYSSAELLTQGKFSQLYGRFEVRAKLPTTAGSWSTVGLLSDAGTWPPGIDLFSHVGRQPDAVGFTNTWGDSSADAYYDYWLLRSPVITPTAWHVYALEWTLDTLRWYVDGRLVHTKNRESIPTDPMFVKIGALVGGDYAGDPTNGIWPQTTEIDYVRAYRPATDRVGILTPVASAGYTVPSKAAKHDPGTFTAYLKYDLSSVPKDATIKLRVYAGTAIGLNATGSPTWAFYAVPDPSFTSDSVATRPPKLGKAIGDLTPGISNSDIIEADITSAVVAARKHGGSFVGLALKAQGADIAEAYWRGSSQSSVHEPTLVWSVGVPPTH